MNMIVKSIKERSILGAMFYNAKQDNKYIDKYCPDTLKLHYTKLLKKQAKKYKIMREMFDNYQDSETLKADKFFKGMVNKSIS